jgi:two-component system, OmpR family, phosphate regulon response regulator PhoB
MRKKILVVEDDQDLVELLAFNLKASGFSVNTASDGAAGLKQARSFRPHLILLDLMLPELDGFAVCEILRRDAATAATPIIMLTAVSSQLARLAGLEAGANDYITKPFSIKHLITRIKGFLTPSPTSRL